MLYLYSGSSSPQKTFSEIGEISNLCYCSSLGTRYKKLWNLMLVTWTERILLAPSKIPNQFSLSKKSRQLVACLNCHCTNGAEHLASGQYQTFLFIKWVIATPFQLNVRPLDPRRALLTLLNDTSMVLLIFLTTNRFCQMYE